MTHDASMPPKHGIDAGPAMHPDQPIKAYALDPPANRDTINVVYVWPSEHYG